MPVRMAILVGFVWNSPLTAAPHSTNARYTPDDYVAMYDVGYSAYTLCAHAELPRQQPEGDDRRGSGAAEYLYLGQRGRRRSAAISAWSASCRRSV